MFRTTKGRTGRTWMACAFTSLCIIGVAGFARPAQAAGDQLVLVDETYTQSAWYKFWKIPGQPSNWTTPLDYSHGMLYVRYEIIEISAPASLQICFFQDSHVSEKHACAPDWKFDHPGVFYMKQEMGALWQRSVIDWTRPLLDFMVIDNTSQGLAKARLSADVIVVAQGHLLEAPDDWPCPSGWACTGGGGGGTGGASGSGGSDTGGASSGGAAPTGGAPSTGGSVSTGGGVSTGGTESTGGSATGGSVSTGGAVASGGTASGGVASSGGASDGGSTSGGSTGAGGVAAAGGSQSGTGNGPGVSDGGSATSPDPDDDDDGMLESGKAPSSSDDSGGCTLTSSADDVPALPWLAFLALGAALFRRRMRRQRAPEA